MNWIIVQPIVQRDVRNLCLTPYHNHPHGCPNYGRRGTCPPEARIFDAVFDITKPVWAIYNVFDLLSHTIEMQKKHPAWSEHQLRCCLYWQGKARKQLKDAIKEFLRTHPGNSVTTCPEAMGVNITKTLKNAGIHLEWPPRIFVYQVALAGRLI